MSLNSLVNDLSTRRLKDKKADDYQEAVRTAKNISPLVPPELSHIFVKIPWCRLCVSVLEERLDVREIDSDDRAMSDYLRSVWQQNNGDAKFSQLATNSLSLGRSYLIITPNTDATDTTKAMPLLEVVDGSEMVHDIDVYTGEVTEAVRVYGENRDQYAYYTPGRIDYFRRKGGEYVPDPDAPEARVLKSKGVPVFPFLNRAEIDDRYGRPEAKEIWELQDAVIRITTEMSVTATTMASPQRAVVGVTEDDLTNPDGSLTSKNALYVSRLLTFADSAADVKEFSAAQTQNFTTATNDLTRKAASLMGVPLSVFGVASEANPSSGDAIREGDTRLVRRVERIARGFTTPLRNALQYVATVYGGFGDASSVRVMWAPPGEPTLQAKADFVSKMAATRVTSDSLYTARALLRFMGWTDPEIEKMEEDKEVDGIRRLMEDLDNASTSTNPENPVTPPNANTG